MAFVGVYVRSPVHGEFDLKVKKTVCELANPQKVQLHPCVYAAEIDKSETTRRKTTIKTWKSASPNNTYNTKRFSSG